MRTPQSQMGAMLLQKKSTMTVVIVQLSDRAIDARRALFPRAREADMTVYVIVQLKMTDRVAYDRYQPNRQRNLVTTKARSQVPGMGKTAPARNNMAGRNNRAGNTGDRRSDSAADSGAER
jgi:hypothetical protein